MLFYQQSDSDKQLKRYSCVFAFPSQMITSQRLSITQKCVTVTLPSLQRQEKIYRHPEDKLPGEPDS
jgi:hypothetical protein